jgi:hypothetical protein
VEEFRNEWKRVRSFGRGLKGDERGWKDVAEGGKQLGGWEEGRRKWKILGKG